MHAYVLCISETPEEAMDGLVELGFDYWGRVEKKEEREGVLLSGIKTVGDARRIDIDKLTTICYGIVDTNYMYWNVYNIMTKEQFNQLFTSVMDAYDDEATARIYVIHV